MYKVLSSDLDGTLYYESTNVSKTNIETIKRAHNQGKKFILASGRGFKEFEKTNKELGLTNSDDYTISFNGALILRNSDNKILYQNVLSYSKAKKLFEVGLKYNVYILMFTLDHVYVYKNSTYPRVVKDSPYVDYFVQRNIDFLKDEIITKVCYERDDINYLKDIEKYLNKEIDGLSISYSSNAFIEINNEGVSKGEGLKQVCKFLNIDIKESIAVGDSENDISMIKDAGLGVVMANAPENIKKYGDYITVNDNKHDGISEVVNKFMLEE